jgi:hypothetical protein
MLAKAALLTILLMLPAAAASSTAKRSESFVACYPADWCDVNIEHNVWSNDVGDCTGSPGAYTSCTIHHRCGVYARGVPEMSGIVVCIARGAVDRTDTCTIGTVSPVSCSAGYADSPVSVAAGTCADFDAEGWVELIVGQFFVVGTPAYATTLTVCVNGNGPY